MKDFKLIPAVMLALALGVTKPWTGWCQESETHSIQVGAVDRAFLVHVPSGLKDAKSVPLVIALHGGGTSGKVMERFSGLDETADKFGFVVVYPDGSGRFPGILTWNSGTCRVYAKTHNIDDVAFLRQLIDHLCAGFNVDPKKVYVTGISNGAMMAYRLAAEAPDRVAAVAAVAGALDIAPQAARAPMPVLHFHGTDDEYVPYAGGIGKKGATGTSFLSVQDTINAWIRANKAMTEPVVTNIPDRFDDETRVVKYAFGTKEDPERIVLYKIIGGGHTWPGRPRRERVLGRTTGEISANEIMWKFFAAHPQKPVSKGN